jgi:hypothetical protein
LSIRTLNLMFKYDQKLKHLERLAKLHADTADRVEHVDIYDAVKAVKKLKIAQLSELLTPLVAKKTIYRLQTWTTALWP